MRWAVVKLALLGVGMIGGSLAQAWRRAGAVAQVTGFDADAAALAAARRAGVIDNGVGAVAAAVADADIVVLAAPVGAGASLLAAVAPVLPAHAIVTDVGSTKSDVVAAARVALGAAFSRFVPAHPIAGRELAGVAHARADLFDGKLVVTTPLSATDAAALERVEAIWRRCGARIERMDPADHDRIFAAVSHMPHLLAFALVDTIAQAADGERKLGFAGAGFRDFTRIAASSPTIWRDVALANRAALSGELQRYRATLERLQQALDAADGAALEALFERASRARRHHAEHLDVQS